MKNRSRAFLTAGLLTALIFLIAPAQTGLLYARNPQGGKVFFWNFENVLPGQLPKSGSNLLLRTPRHLEGDHGQLRPFRPPGLGTDPYQPPVRHNVQTVLDPTGFLSERRNRDGFQGGQGTDRRGWRHYVAR